MTFNDRSKLRLLGPLYVLLTLFLGCDVPGFTGHVDEQAFEDLIQSNDVVLVKFGASYCGPCVQLDGQLDLVTDELPDNVKIVRLKTSQNRELCAKFNVRSIPRMLMYRNGSQVGDRVGYMDERQIRDWLGIDGGADQKGAVQSNPFAIYPKPERQLPNQTNRYQRNLHTYDL